MAALVAEDCSQGCHGELEALMAHANHHQVVDSSQDAVVRVGRSPTPDHEPCSWIFAGVVKPLFTMKRRVAT